MDTENLIPVNTLCTHYQVELSFFNDLQEFGLIEIEIIEQSSYIQEDKINDLEKIIRLRHDLELNMEGIDVIFNLLNKLDAVQKELLNVKNKLHFYED